jgi:Ca2+-binding RTX toxin-like protein
MDMATFYDRKNVDNVWVGGKQDDVMSGNGGNDNIHGGGGKDRIYGGDGNDQLFGDDGNDFLQGGDGADSASGGAGNDVIHGGGGGDTLSGGAGADTFVYNFQADSNAATGIDTILDFHPEEGDRINIGATVEGYSYNQSYDWDLVADSSLVTNDHQQMTLTYDAGTNLTTLNMYFGDGDPDVDMTLYILGSHTTADGFMLIGG